MVDVYLCAPRRSAIGRFGGTLSSVRPDDLAAHVMKAVMETVPSLDPGAIEEVILGCANQAGEDNRNVARMSALLAGMPSSVPGTTMNRLCGSGMDAVGTAFRAIKSGDLNLVLAGGVESMSRAPYVIGKANTPFARNQTLEDTTIGWRFVNPLMKSQYGVDSMPETAENVAEQFNISREDQDKFALHSQMKASHAQRNGVFAQEITPINIPRRKQEDIVFAVDEHPRETSSEQLSKLPTPFRENGSVTAGNASGVNDGAAAMLVASEHAAKAHGLTPLARIIGMTTAGVEPRIMGMGPLPASTKLLSKHGLTMDSIDVIELNEAFASQSLAVLRGLHLNDNDPRVNPNGGAIALGHPLGMSGARLLQTAALQLKRTGGRLALCTMCVGVGQGVSMLIERV